MARAESPGLSVVIPTWNEARRLGALLDDLCARPGIVEVIVCDGGSDDDTRRVVAERSTVRWMCAPRGRGSQLDAGARAARGEALLFLHADARLPPDAVSSVTRCLAGGGVVAGAFRTRTCLDDEDVAWFRPILRLADLRSQYTRHPYGDQALFCWSWAYRRAGGFPRQALLEDVELARRLRAIGRLEVLPEAVEVSARRWLARPLRTALVMNAFPVLYRLGVGPDRLARWYGSPR